ncbi:MAG: hypothetical protein H8E66_24870 [Planctomycetes bacterium]|nr:hypothetical protein [Planctomycetota bacterium]
MNSQEDHDVDRLLHVVMDVDVPIDVEQKLRSQLSEFRSQTVLSDKSPTPRQGIWSHRAWSGLAATATVAIVLTAIVAWSLRPRTSFADVATAALKLPWIHVTTTHSNGESNETWYSPSKGISASRHKGWTEYHDHQLKVYYSYDMKEGVLYRVPESSPRRMSESMTAILPLLLQDEQLVDAPLERMEFLGPLREEMKLVEQTLRRVEDGDRQWLEFDLKVQFREEPMQMLFRVDPDTKLPQLCRFEGRWEGKEMVSEKRFDYPEKGPADVYELGVPETAKLVDRVPSEDIERILKTIRVGRDRMDNYRAIVITHRPNQKWWLERPLIMYRKGDKFRSDQSFSSGEVRSVERPAEDEDMTAWWQRRANDFNYYPMYLVEPGADDPLAVQTTHFERSFVTDNDGATQVRIDGVKNWTSQSELGERFPPYWSRRPEFICRPPMGVPNQHMEPVLEMNPTTGPPDTVLLHVRVSGRRPQAAPDPKDKRKIRQPDAFRFWLHPLRDHAITRWEMLDTDEHGEEIVTSSKVIEKMEKSPQGMWYGSQVRITSKNPSGGESVQLVRIYVDFDAEVPDSLFEPPKVGRVY